MKQILNLYVLILITLASPHAIGAVKVFECEDEAGNRAFYNACPPGTYVIKEKKLSTGVSSDNKGSSVSITATLYSTPDCDTCDEVREFLQNRKIAITEKSVDKDINNQQELKELTGALKVPSAIIGEKTVIGYNRGELKAALNAVGYIEEGQEKTTEEK